MNETELRTVIRVMERWGFGLFFPFAPDRPGFRVLAVAMRPQPTYAHYDPERMRLALERGRNVMERATVYMDSPLTRGTRVGPGNLILEDRVEKRVTFYTYGGRLEVIRNGLPRAGTLFALSSPAPILALDTMQSVGVEDQLAAASEALLARLRARQRRRGLDPDAQLAQLSPATLYAGCIQSLYDEYNRVPALGMTFPALHRLLQREQAGLAAAMNGRVTALEQRLDHFAGRRGLTAS